MAADRILTLSPFRAIYQITCARLRYGMEGTATTMFWYSLLCHAVILNSFQDQRRSKLMLAGARGTLDPETSSA